MAPAALTLGAPGVYVTPDPVVHTLTGVRMDVAGFVGVAPRGPARVPWVGETWPDTGAIVEPQRPRSRSVAVAVESFDDYVRLFGAYEGPGRLPYAVASFFQQGGRRAWVVRIVHEYGDPALDAGGVAATTLKGVEGDIVLRARDEGVWGDGLRARLSYATRPLLATPSTPAELALAPAERLDAGTLVRTTLHGGMRVLRFVDRVDARPRPAAPGVDRFAVLESPPGGEVIAVEVVEGVLDISDGAGRTEQHTALGLDWAHPRWLATVLCRESTLVWPDAAWRAGRVAPDAADLHAAATGAFVGGEDRYREIVPGDCFDLGWTPGDTPDIRVTAGVQALLDIEELSLLCVPDLYEPAAFERPPSIVSLPSVAGADFEPCLAPGAPAKQAQPVQQLGGLVLDPTIPADLAAISALQAQLVWIAETQRSWIMLLDVPPGLTQRQMLAWRSAFDSMWAAAYHPWLDSAALGPGAGAVVARIPPSAPAAGIAARTEWASGVPHGPSNEIAAGVVSVEDQVGPARHDELHLAAINVFLPQRDGILLSSARTLSRDPQWRELSVRRVVSMIERALTIQMQWAVFEPNDPGLGATLRHLLESFLESLFRANAFAGATPAEAFFVHVDQRQDLLDLGRVVVDVGIAPAEPLEYIVLRFVVSGDGTLLTEAGGA